MKVPLLKEAIDKYANAIQRAPILKEAYWATIQENFQANWDVKATDFYQMYDQSLESSVSRRWWYAENYEPKAMMLAFIKLNQAFVQAIFEHLFDESIDLDIRISKFKTHLDVLFVEYQQSKVQAEYGQHQHDQKMIWLYLSLKYPDQYAYFDPLQFQKVLQGLGAQKPLEPYEYERSLKLIKTIKLFLLKKEGLAEAFVSKMNFTNAPDPSNMLLCSHFIHHFPTFKV